MNKLDKNVWYVVEDYVDYDVMFKTEVIFDETDGWILREGHCGIGEGCFWVWTEYPLTEEEAYEEVFGES